MNQTAPRAAMDPAANLAFFLLEKTGSIFGRFAGRLTFKQQRLLMGCAIGKGVIIIDGSTETVCNRVRVCFGLDYDDRNVISWGALCRSGPDHQTPGAIAF